MRVGRRSGAVALGLVLAVCGCSGGDATSKPTPAPAMSTRPTPAASGNGATALDSAGLGRFYRQKPAWRDCGDGFQCTRVTVPLDYGRPAGRAIGLSVNRLRARSSAKRQGSLLVNPGGPGGSGLDYARGARSLVSGAVRERFDVVGFDPRGVGKSTPVRCLDDKETDAFIAADGSPDTRAEEQRLVDLSRRFGARCAQRSGYLLAHIGTRDVARDMDLLRAVLGDAKLTYLGKSYGTALGAAYAELFPTHVRALVLDGALDPSSSGSDVLRRQSIGFETALTAFVDDCRRRSNCPLPRRRASALAAVGAILAAADRQPLTGDGGRTVTQGIAFIGVGAALYDDSAWPLLRDALSEAQRGDGSTLALLADFYTDRNENGHYTSNSNDALYAVNCLDRPAPGVAAGPAGPAGRAAADAAARAVVAARAAASALSRVAPRFGPTLAWGDLPCATWPVTGSVRPHPIKAAGAAPILVVGTLRDPATPYVWAQNLARELASGHLLTWDGDGHTAYRRGSGCIDRAVDAYLIKGSLPRSGARC